MMTGGFCCPCVRCAQRTATFHSLSLVLSGRVVLVRLLCVVPFARVLFVSMWFAASCPTALRLRGRLGHCVDVVLAGEQIGDDVAFAPARHCSPSTGASTARVLHTAQELEEAPLGFSLSFRLFGRRATQALSAAVRPFKQCGEW